MAKKKKHWIRWTLLGLVALIVIGLAGASVYMYNYAFVPGEKSFLESDESPRLKKNKAWLAQINKQRWTQTSATDNLKLVADYIPATKQTTKTIVVAHGFMGKKEDMANFIRLYHRLGYNVLAPDDRGSGESSGNYIGYGWPDRLDYVKWINQVVRRLGNKSQISLFGVSMGGATVMYTAGEKLPSQVKSIIEDCGYDSIAGELTYQLKELFNLPEFPLIYTTSLVARLKANYNIFDGETSKTLARNKLPIFFIHGAKDTFVPTEMVYRNYKAASQPKKIWVVPGAGHAEAYKVATKLYEKKVAAFLQDNWSN